jgi:CarD family transcriptional regulator
MFSIGDLIVHPMHGAGVIEDIIQEKVAGVLQEYYVFKMPTCGLTLKIPTANAHVIGIRGILSRQEVGSLMDAIPGIPVEANSNWNRRYQENMQRLKSGDLLEVAKVVKSLLLRDTRRGLSTGERKMLHSAKQILVSELSLSRDISYEEAEGCIDRVLHA